ncbi:MAG: hypothetical protein A3G18_11850 [Rhodospirillales bacterium RIFCSPLOWO2_12_FULL_58_28]|nr:MAG: hypothetical protein A3H92_12040 [Rhodospirillales bacterium RIFCSPLOWO2_02_FULL_58_16]OHC77507.1 MAG: hypothetical protein A3G18_11850 [Rhodospirillales bacterium RIFCSPLOWO2_12_FULL_58_28]
MQTNAERPLLMLAYGFRPFFLLAGIYGTLAVAVWTAAYVGALPLPRTFSPMLWHGHEMLFGFTAAVLSGFLMTAIPNWTQSSPVSGGRLAALVALWFAGRLAFLMSDFLPAVVTAAVDLALIPTLAVMATAPIFAMRQKHNYFFPALLAAFFVADLLIHLEAMGLTAATAESGLYLAMYVVAMFLSLISGRIVPNFTAGALRMRGENVEARISMPLELSIVALMIAVAVADLVFDSAAAGGALALVVAGLLAFRMLKWNTGKILDTPLLWVLHLGVLWLATGFACLGLADLTGFVAKSTAFHALTIGAGGTMALGVMTRASLGHTGRPFVLAKPIPAAYILISLAAVTRVFAPAIMPSAYQAFIVAAGLMWAAAFAIFAIVYWPVLTGPRADGKPG